MKIYYIERLFKNVMRNILECEIEYDIYGNKYERLEKLIKSMMEYDYALYNKGNNSHTFKL